MKTTLYPSQNIELILYCFLGGAGFRQYYAGNNTYDFDGLKSGAYLWAMQNEIIGEAGIVGFSNNSFSFSISTTDKLNTARSIPCIKKK